jgi:hypothetical protein
VFRHADSDLIRHLQQQLSANALVELCSMKYQWLTLTRYSPSFILYRIQKLYTVIRRFDFQNDEAVFKVSAA